MEDIIVQRIKSVDTDSFLVAEKYYSILSAINSLKLTQREVQLVAFTAIRGNISYTNFREEFCERCSTTAPTINNIISRLKKIGMLIKVDGKIKVNSILILNFNVDIKLEVRLTHELPKKL